MYRVSHHQTKHTPTRSHHPPTLPYPSTPTSLSPFRSHNKPLIFLSSPILCKSVTLLPFPLPELTTTSASDWNPGDSNDTGKEHSGSPLPPAPPPKLNGAGLGNRCCC